MMRFFIAILVLGVSFCFSSLATSNNPSLNCPPADLINDQYTTPMNQAKLSYQGYTWIISVMHTPEETVSLGTATFNHGIYSRNPSPNDTKLGSIICRYDYKTADMNFMLDATFPGSNVYLPDNNKSLWSQYGLLSDNIFVCFPMGGGDDRRKYVMQCPFYNATPQ